MLLSLILQITQGVADSAASVPVAAPLQPKQDTLSLLDLLLKGGYIMIPIGLLSIISIYVLIDKFITIRRAGAVSKDFMNNVKDQIKKGNLEGLKSILTPAFPLNFENLVDSLFEHLLDSLRRIAGEEFPSQRVVAQMFSMTRHEATQRMARTGKSHQSRG